MTALRIGTRASALAQYQSGLVGHALAAAAGRGDAGVELVHVSTHGDRDRISPLAQIGGTGVFVTAVREALLAGEVDVIVHSAKDLPTQPAEGIELACIPARGDVRDALCGRDGATLASLPRGAQVGTGSPRRAAQLLRARPDLRVVAVRGNVDTRLARAQGPDADLDAVVLAAAGLQRLGREDAITELLDVDVMLPAPAQGALAVECRTADVHPAPGTAPTPLAVATAAVDDLPTRAAVTAERALLRALEAGCSAPVAALGRLDGDQLELRALAISTDGTQVFEGTLAARVDLSVGSGPVAMIAADLGTRLAERLLLDGAGAVLSGIGAQQAAGEAALDGAAAETPPGLAGAADPSTSYEAGAASGATGSTGPTS